MTEASCILEANVEVEMPKMVKNRHRLLLWLLTKWLWYAGDFESEPLQLKPWLLGI